MQTITQQAHAAPPTPAHRQLTEHDVSDIADATNLLLSALHCPRSVRPLMHALMGFLAGRTTKASFYHFDLARRMDKLEYIEDPDEFARYKAAAVSRVRAAIDKMKRWNDQWDGLNIEYTPGGRKQNGDLYPSTIQTPLLSWVSEIASEAQAIEGFTRMTERERAEAFRRIIGGILRKKRIRRREKPIARVKKELSIEQLYRMTAAMGTRCIAKVQERGQEVTPELIHSIANKLAKEWTEEFGGVGYVFTHHPEQNETPAAEDLPHYANVSVVPENLASTTPDESQAGIGGACDSSIVVTDNIEDTAELRELDAFMSVGVDVFDVLLIDDTKKKDDACRQRVRGITSGELACEFPTLKARADKHRWSLIIMPRPDSKHVEMIDDIDGEIAAILRPYAFDVKETSEGNYQAFIAFKDEADKESTGPRLIEGLRQMFPQSKVNAGSGGATRWAGSRNYKPKRRRPDGTYPTVVINSIQPGRYVTPEELDGVGLLAPERQASSTDNSDYRMTGRWMPDYQRCLNDAPLRADGKERDVSRADASFVTLGLLAGNSRQTMAGALQQVSPHARDHRTPEGYVTRTVQEVASYLEMKNGRQYI